MAPRQSFNRSRRGTDRCAVVAIPGRQFQAARRRARSGVRMGAASRTVTPSRMTRATTMKRSWGPAPAARSGKVIDLERYAPAYLTFVANKLGRGASRNYLRVFDVGVETWRCLVLLAIHTSITAVTLCTAPSGSHCGSYGLAKIVDTAWMQFQKEALP